MTGRRWFENQALAVAVAVAVAVGLYVWRGGHYPLPVDLMALTSVALFVYTGARQLTLARTTDTKENDPVTDLPIAPRDEHSSTAGDPAHLEAVRAKLDLDGQPSATDWKPVTVSSSPLEIPTFDRSWHPNEITGWLAVVEDDENVSDADLTRARKAVAHALGVDDDATAGA